MRKIYSFLCYLFLFLIIASCEQGGEIVTVPEVINQYDSSKPTAVDEILPERGIIDQTFTVNGNFPGELSDMKVYFADKKAVITSTNGKSITGLVPKQPDGLNQISVVIGNDSIVPGIQFKYKQSRSVKTIAGILGESGWMDNYAGHALDAVTFEDVSLVATVEGQSQDDIILIKSGWWDAYVFLISQDDYELQRLEHPDHIAQPAVTSTRDGFYTTRWWGGDNPVYYYSKEDGWTWTSVGVTVSENDLPGAHVSSTTFAEDDNLFYMIDSDGRIAEVNLEELSYKVYTSAAKKPSGMNEDNYGGEIKGDLPTNFGGWIDVFLTYSDYHKCFFASFGAQHAIYKLVKNDDGSWTSTLHAGDNGRGIETGDRLTDAKFCNPRGVVVNDDGEIFVVNEGVAWWDSFGHCIMKIDGNAVEIVAGNPINNNPLQNGDPMEATFNSPRGIAIDSEGNYFIGGNEDRTLRKLSIE